MAADDKSETLSTELLKWLVGMALLLCSATFGYTLKTESRLTTLETAFAAHLTTMGQLTQSNERRLAAIEAAQAENARQTNEKLDRIADNVSLIQGALRLKTAN